jgi:hypothetical protein
LLNAEITKNPKTKDMKTMIKIFGTATVLLLLSTSSFAQESETALASADIVTPISIDWVSDLEFANVAVQAATGGTVILDPVYPIVRGVSEIAYSGCTLPATAGSTPTAAAFDIHGTPDYTYSISLPASCLLTNTLPATGTMTVDLFTSTPTPTGQLDNAGYEILYVGATLNVGAGQTPGHYVSGTPFTVTVNYN